MHVLAPARFGGLERVVTTLAKSQHSSGYQVHVVLFVARDEQPSHVGRELKAAGITVHEVASGDRDYIGKLRNWRRYIRQIEPDVIHTHGYVADVFGSLLNRSDFCLISTVHGFTGGNWKNLLYERLQRRAFRRFDAVVGVSRPISKLLIDSGCARNRVHAITNAWSPTEPALDAASARVTLGLAAGAFNIGWVGRVSYEKGLDVLVDALPAVSDLELMLTVIGEGNERENVQRRAEQLNVSTRIRWTGVIDNAAQLLPAFDAVVISSRTEGTPIVLLEAISAGVPLITAAVGGIPDLVSSQEALLVPPDNPAALAAGLRSVYSDPKAAASRASCARSRTESLLAVEPWVEAYFKVYRSARESRHGRWRGKVHWRR